MGGKGEEVLEGKSRYGTQYAFSWQSFLLSREWVGRTHPLSAVGQEQGQVPRARPVGAGERSLWAPPPAGITNWGWPLGPGGTLRSQAARRGAAGGVGLPRTLPLTPPYPSKRSLVRSVQWEATRGGTCLQSSCREEVESQWDRAWYPHLSPPPSLHPQADTLVPEGTSPAGSGSYLLPWSPSQARQGFRAGHGMIWWARQRAPASPREVNEVVVGVRVGLRLGMNEGLSSG